MDSHRRQDLGRGDVEARLRAAVEGEARQPAARRARPGAGRHAPTASRCSCRCRSSTGSSNNVYAIDNDTRLRRLAAALRRARCRRRPRRCPGGITAGATRIVRLDARPPPPRRLSFGGAARSGYRSLLGEPGEGVPVEGRAAGRDAARRSSAPPARRTPARRLAAPRRAAQPAPPRSRRRRRGASRPIAFPASPARSKRAHGRAFGMALSARPASATSISSDGMLHVLGLPSGKDIQRPAPFLPANASWSVADRGGHDALRRDVGRLRRRAERRLGDRSRQRREAGRVVEDERRRRRRRRGVHVGRHADRRHRRRSDDRRRQGERDRRARSEDAAGEGLVHAAGGRVRDRTDDLRHDDKDIVAAATKDGRVLLLDAASLGGADHATPLHASKPCLATGATVSGDALAAWQQPGSRHDVDSAAGRRRAWRRALPTTNGPVSARRRDRAEADATAAARSRSSRAGSRTTSRAARRRSSSTASSSRWRPACRPHRRAGHAGRAPRVRRRTGKRLWNSGKAMTTFASPGSFWSARAGLRRRARRHAPRVRLQRRTVQSNAEGGQMTRVDDSCPAFSRPD